MPAILADNQYGKSRVRLVKVERHGTHHEFIDVSVDIKLSGDFAAAYQDGDNRRVLPTDTMKNTVYALAGRGPIGEIEQFGQRLADHFLSRHAHIARASIAISQSSWKRIHVGGRAHDHAFLHGGDERRTAVVEQDRNGVRTRSGIRDLVVLKTTNSAFVGYIRDEYTTLKETGDRIFGTAVTADWTYRGQDLSYGPCWHAVRETMLEIFAGHESQGVQHTLYAMGEAILDRVDAIAEIHIAMPNRHCLLVDLAPFGIDNPNEVFLPIEEPHGLIEATLTRSEPSES
jgi:urate oxidase